MHVEQLQSTVIENNSPHIKPEAEGADGLGLKVDLGLMVGFGVSGTSGEVDSSIAFTVSAGSLLFSCLFLFLFY